MSAPSSMFDDAHRRVYDALCAWVEWCRPEPREHSAVLQALDTLYDGATKEMRANG